MKLKTAHLYPLIVALVLMMTVSSGLADNQLKSGSKLSFRLEVLSDNLNSDVNDRVSLQTLGLNPSGEFSLLKNDLDQLLVYIRVEDASQENVEALERNGASVTHVSDRYNTITAYVSLTDLESLAALEFVKHISEVVSPMRNQASCATAVTSEGDSQLKADQARTQYQVDGSDVTVGVLSDSYAGVTSPTSAADDILSGDLPGANNPCGQTTPVIVVEDYTGSSPSDEGRAMMQIVHDLAPGSTLAFATAFNGLIAFADNIKKLRSQTKADVIVDDVSYYSEPFFQDGPVSTAIDEVTADGALYFTSAGNSNAEDGNGNLAASYEAAAYRPTTCPTVSYQGVVQQIGDSCHNFNPSGDTPYQAIELASGGYFRAIFQWAEPWYGVVTDLELIVTDTSGNILTYSTETNTGSTGSQTPFEAVAYQNTTGSSQTVRIIVSRASGSTPRIKYVFIRSSGLLSTQFNASNSTDTFGPTVFGHAGCAGALSIAAVPYNDSASPESFTSHGYFTVYYGPVSGTTPAAKLSSPETRQKPDVAATDGGANTFFGQQVGSTWRFYGTSAAAPHAAAVAALMSENFYNANNARPTQASVETAMENSAAAIANGSQAITGAGLLDALAALAENLSSGGGGTGTGGGSSGGGGGSGGGCFLSTSR